MKRFFDIALSILLIILFSPIMMFISVLVFMNLGNNVLFIQKRPGLDSTIFELIKFRTMLDAYDENGVLLSDVERLTKFGNLLRSTSLDEIPSLFNVLKGDMSFVGPRPLLVEYLPLYSTEQSQRHNVRPGITGWAQVNGRNAISWEKKFKLDVWYVDNQSFFLDMKILFLTVKKVFIREGINANGEATMASFKGRDD